MTRLLKPEHKTFIEGLQPYEGRPDYHPLNWLEEINNSDKHRLIQVVGAKLAIGPGLAWMGDREIIPLMSIDGFTILENGAEIYSDIPPDVQVVQNIVPSIAFANGCEIVKGRGVIFILNKIAILVSDIIDSFPNEF